MDTRNGAAVEIRAPQDTLGTSATADGGLGIQYREAVRVRIHFHVCVVAPVQLWCETVDISVLGIRLDRKLPRSPTSGVWMILEVRDHGPIRSCKLELGAEVVRVSAGETGLRFTTVTAEQRRALRKIVHDQQELVSAMRRASRHS